MFNPFVMKKYAALFMPGFICAITFFLGTLYYGIFGGLVFFAGGLLISVVVGNLLLQNPFSVMLEGKGILTINMDSTGVLRPFIVSVQSPFIRGVVNGQPVEDVFDRGAIFNLAAPVVSGVAEPQPDGGVNISIDEETFNRGRFALFHFPVLLYNEQTKSIITKDFFGEKEKDAFAEHGVLYLNRKVEELTSAIRDFGRHVVENLKPKAGLFKSKWFMVVLFIAIVILVVLFAPSIIGAVKNVSGAVGSAAGSAGGAAGGAVGKVTPR